MLRSVTVVGRRDDIGTSSTGIAGVSANTGATIDPAIADAFGLTSDPAPSVRAVSARGVTEAVKDFLQEVKDLTGLPLGTKAGTVMASSRRIQAFGDAVNAAQTPDDVCAIIKTLAANAKEARPFLSSNNAAAMLVRLRDDIPMQMRAGLVGQLQTLATTARAILPLVVALAPEHYACISEGLQPKENLTHRRSELLGINLKTALANLPPAFFEKARQLMVAKIGASASAEIERQGLPKGQQSEAECSRRSHEVLLNIMAEPALKKLIPKLEAAASTDEVCKLIDAHHDWLYAGLGGGRGNPGFARVVELMRGLQQDWPDAFDDRDAVYGGATVANSKWRLRDSDVDLAFERHTCRKVIEHCPREDKKWALENNGVANWLRSGETRGQRILGTNRPEGELLSLAIQQYPDGTLMQGGPEFLGANPIAVRSGSKMCHLHIFDPDYPEGPPLYARPL